MFDPTDRHNPRTISDEEMFIGLGALNIILAVRGMSLSSVTGFLATLGALIRNPQSSNALTTEGAAIEEAVVGESCAYKTWSLGSNHTAKQWENMMAKRGWTPQSISEAINLGRPEPARLKWAPYNPATRYYHPDTGKVVVRDNITGEVIHIGGPGFKY